MSEVVLELKNITKYFPGVLALDNISFDIKAGEIHAICGENGAGKSTLIKCCTGAVVPDSGEICVNGKSYNYMTPQYADANGIAVIYQELNSVKDLCAAENVFLGNEIKKGPLVDRREMAKQAEQIFKNLNVQIDPYAMVKDLTIGYRQMIEIAKAIARKARILIMDEPSAPLTNNEIEKMFVLIEKLKSEGVAIVYISHRLPEVIKLADRISIMRDGRKIKTVDKDDTSEDEIIRMMVGRTLSTKYPQRKNHISNEILLETEHLTGNGDIDISFKLRKGEILGLAGLIGAGRTELAELIFGAGKIESGTVKWKGRKIHFNSPQKAIEAGIFLCPEDRKLQGLFLPRSIKENISVSSLNKFLKYKIIDDKQVNSAVDSYIEELGVKTPSQAQLTKNLSGGNQQKVVLAKSLMTDPELIIFDEPTRGIDVGAKFEIYQLMNDLIAEGKTIIMISSEMEELLGLADRIIILAEGHFSGELRKDEFNQETIMKYASKAF